MKKIISLFKRNYDGDRLVRNEVTEGAEWVIEGGGLATRKYNGTACMVRYGKLFKRFDAKKGKTPPPEFEPSQEPDTVTGHWPGWIPVGDGPEDKWHREAFIKRQFPNGTYELCGPKIQGNPERFTEHTLVPHGADILPDVPRDFEGLKHYFEIHDYEGIVWYHPEEWMVKIKARDFGIKRKLLQTDTLHDQLIKKSFDVNDAVSSDSTMTTLIANWDTLEVGWV